MTHITNSTKRAFKNILVTGGAGFIGSNFIRYLFELGSLQLPEESNFSGRIINLDALTYAGNPDNLSDLQSMFGTKASGTNAGRYIFEHGDINDRLKIESIFTRYEIDTVVHFAAESHVDRSIHGPEAFIRTNVLGSFTLLDVARNMWEGRDDVLFHHISTDEVFGSLGESGYFTEETPYDPRSPYSSSKASSDHLARAYFHTYGLPLTISNCSNNYGPFQFPEKLIPVMILNILARKPLPVYGDGKNIRDWLYVEDHNSAVWMIMNNAKSGSTWNIGGENEWENIKLVKVLIETCARLKDKDPAEFTPLITYVKDRPGHDRRYAIDCSKIKRELEWKQSVNFEQGIERTVRWYLQNSPWIEGIKNRPAFLKD